MRRRKLIEDLTGFSVQPVQRHIGRPKYLSNEQLHDRREQLTAIFEGIWYEIGWELRKPKNPDDLIQILGPIKETSARDIVSVFFRKTSEPASANNLRRVRREWRAITEPKISADEIKRKAQERLQRVGWALSQARKNEHRMVKQVQKKRRKEFAEAAKAARRLAETERDLERRLRGLEASVARQELYRFLKSKRYALNPLSLANAIAGLPHIGWRQSMRRCRPAPRVVTEGLSYQIFKAIRYITESTGRKSPKALIMSFREQIPLLPSRYRLARSELAEKWFYLERAIRRAYGLKPRRKELPFVITKQYYMQTRSQSQVERILAEQVEITLAKTRRRSLSLPEQG